MILIFVLLFEILVILATKALDADQWSLALGMVLHTFLLLVVINRYSR